MLLSDYRGAEKHMTNGPSSAERERLAARGRELKAKLDELRRQNAAAHDQQDWATTQDLNRRIAEISDERDRILAELGYPRPERIGSRSTLSRA